MPNYTPFKINGTTIPTPTEYGFEIDDLSSDQSGRTLDGIMHKDVVAVKDVYTCTWKKLSWQDTAQLLGLVNGKTRVTLTYYDPRRPNKLLINDFYVGKRTGKANNLRNPTNTWQDITFQFIRI